MSHSQVEDPRKQAWLHSFLEENHLNYRTSPELVASPAQLRFMVYLEPDELFYPCSLRIFDEIMARVKSPFLGELYSEVWARTSRLVSEQVENQERRDFIIDLLNIKYQHETANYNVIPSRLEKRLFKLFVVTTQIEDPLMEEKRQQNMKAADIYHNEVFARAMGEPPDPAEPQPLLRSQGLEGTRHTIDATKLRRLFQASARPDLWMGERETPTLEEWRTIFSRPVTGDGFEPLLDFLLTPEPELIGHWVPRKILYLAERAGEIVFDLAVIRFLVRLGHTVILAVKNAASYDRIYLGDIVNCGVLQEFVRNAEVITAPFLSKNQLADLLRNDKRFKIITDGTMEKINLMRASVAFARSFKEVDGVIVKGIEQRGRFFESPFEFTQNIFSLAPGEDGDLSITWKPVSDKVVRFTNEDLEKKAEEIVVEMRRAKESGMTVMFYSGVVGSIPGELDTAIEIMTTFVENLKRQQARTFVINPSKHFESGMDADDLMYMWEIVQRSGLIDIWRFQTYQDIETSFSLLNRRVPPQWVGKDSTYSTGCTKEMAIALDVQKKNPEMQIIAPDPERFTRRSEYGIGMFHDTRLMNIYER